MLLPMELLYLNIHKGLKLTGLRFIEVLRFAFAGLDSLFLHSQRSWDLLRHRDKEQSLKEPFLKCI